MEGGVWRTISGRRVFIKAGQSLTEAMKESNKFDKENLQKRLRERLYKIFPEKNNEEWKKITKSDVIIMNSNKEIVNYFKEKYNIELINLDKLKTDDIKPALCGVDDFLKDFPEARKGLNKIEYVPGLRGAQAMINSNKLMEIRKDGFSNYGTGIHEASHALDFGKSSILDKEKYSERIINDVLKEKGIRKNSKGYMKLLEDYYTKKDIHSVGKAILKKIKGEK